MTTKQGSKPIWPAGVLIASSIPIVMTFIQIIVAIVSELTTHDGIYDTTAENLALFGGLYFAIPCALINFILGNHAYARDWVTRRFAVTGYLIGILGMLIGLLAWGMFYVFSHIVF